MLSPNADGERPAHGGVPTLRISASPSHSCKQLQNACHISAKSWSSTSGIHYHRVLDSFPSTVKFAHAGACKSLFVNESLSEKFRMSNSSSTECVSAMNCHANDRVSPAPRTVVQLHSVRCRRWSGSSPARQKTFINQMVSSRKAAV
jgi:hypothetical protein